MFDSIVDQREMQEVRKERGRGVEETAWERCYCRTGVGVRMHWRRIYYYFFYC